MFEKIKFKAIVFFSVFFVLCFAYNVSATPINTSATVVTSVTVAEVTPFSFGAFVPDPAGDIVAFDAGGSISSAGTTVFVGGDVGGEASTTGPIIASFVEVFVVGTVLSGPGLDMPLVGNCMGPNGGLLGTDNGSCTFTSIGGVEIVQIGGKLTVGAGQTPGAYSGTIEVTAGYY